MVYAAGDKRTHPLNVIPQISGFIYPSSELTFTSGCLLQLAMHKEYNTTLKLNFLATHCGFRI